MQDRFPDRGADVYSNAVGSLAAHERHSKFTACILQVGKHFPPPSTFPQRPISPPLTLDILATVRRRVRLRQGQTEQPKCQTAPAAGFSHLKKSGIAMVEHFHLQAVEQLLQGEFPTAAFPEDLRSATLTRARLEFGECVLESVPEDVQECATRLRPILDHLANAAGLATSLYPSRRTAASDT
jgi:hypothetical protein